MAFSFPLKIQQYPHPSGGFPAAKRRSFMRDTIPARAGADADVPPICWTLPPTTTTKLCPAAEMSGNPLCKKQNPSKSEVKNRGVRVEVDVLQTIETVALGGVALRV